MAEPAEFRTQGIWWETSELIFHTMQEISISLMHCTWLIVSRETESEISETQFIIGWLFHRRFAFERDPTSSYAIRMI